MMSALDFHHSRSNSVTSNHSATAFNRLPPGAIPEDLYRPPYHHPSLMHPDPIQNQPSALKAPLRPSHIRARVAASPYPRDTDSLSSSSETEDMSLYLSSQSGDYPGQIYGAGPGLGQEAMHATGALGRMSIGQDQGLEKLAANVRAATTTSASDRAKQIFVQAWLAANYAPYPDGNVPRQGLYFSYRRVCDQYGIPHINTATLGKAIRLCFPTIKTRRLGVRGNSKYHYCGIRPATAAEAEWLQDYIQKSNNNAAQASVNAARAANRAEDRSDEDEDDGSEGANSVSGSKRNSLLLQGDVKNLPSFDDLSDKTPTAATLLSQAQSVSRPTGTYPPTASIRRYPAQETNLTLPAASAPSVGSGGYVTPQPNSSVRQFPNFPSIEDAVANSTSAHGMVAREVWSWFQDHLDALLESIRTFRIDQFEMHLRTFWTSLNGVHREIVHAPAIAGIMAKADAMVYDEILEILRSQMLSPIPAPSLSNLRQLALKMEKILLVALENYGNTFVEPKVELGARFGHLVLRFLDIYQVTQALNTVLTNQKQLAEMRKSWQKVDFESVRNQSALVCNCRHEDLVQLLEVEFVAVLDALPKSSEPVREVMSWADKCCERLMGNTRSNQGNHEERGTMSSRSVLIRWGYVTSQVMRDLTIRSDPAFGAFQILKLFLDDWIAVNVLRNVALSTNSVAASVEPVMQQNFFSLGPDEGFGSMDVRPQNMMAHTPTTSSMLAALQQDTYGPSLDATGSVYNPDGYGPMAYMDTGANHDDPLGSAHQSGLSFSDFTGSGGTFDVSFTSQDLGLGATPASEADQSQHDQEAVKADQPASS